MLKITKVTELTDLDDRYHYEKVILREYFKPKEGLDNIDFVPYDNDCEKIENCILKIDDVFDLIYNAGKNLLNFCTKNTVIQSKNNKTNINDIIGSIFCNENTKIEYTKMYTDWIKENGYPYSKDFSREIEAGWFYFIEDSIMLYIIYEIHKWICKINNQISNSSKIISPTNKLEYLISLIKDNLINILADNSVYVLGNSSNEEDSIFLQSQNINDNREEYFNVIQRALLVYTTSFLYDKKFKDFFSVTKRYIIFNEHNHHYRLYNSANCLIGIAYHKLLFDLTTNQYNYSRRICANPECTNEFERNGKKAYCDICDDKHIPIKIKNKKYNDGTRKNKRTNQMTNPPT